MNIYYRTTGYKSSHGFSLVELAVVLTIIGITLAGAIDLATTKTESDRTTETDDRLDAIEQALQVFVIKNQRLPCPADASLVSGSASAGREGATPSPAIPPGCTGSNFNNGSGIYSGTVPTRTLGINDKNMADDWDRRFTYIVDYRFANNYTTNASCSGNICFKQTTAGSITVNDSTGSARTTEAVYVIISHGKNGYGAYKYTGSATRLSASSDTDETSNAGNDAGSFDAVFVQKDSTTTFDDIVRYSTKALVIDDVNGITDATTCTAAYDAANSAGTLTDPCPGAAGSALNCYALATQVNNLCLQP